MHMYLNELLADRRKYEQIDKRHTDLTSFTNNVLATFTDRREGEFYSERDHRAKSAKGG